MTTLERLALAVSSRLSGDDLVLVLDYAAALERQTRLDALSDMKHTSPAKVYDPDDVRNITINEVIAGISMMHAPTQSCFDFANAIVTNIRNMKKISFETVFVPRDEEPRE